MNSLRTVHLSHCQTTGQLEWLSLGMIQNAFISRADTPRGRAIATNLSKAVSFFTSSPDFVTLEVWIMCGPASGWRVAVAMWERRLHMHGQLCGSGRRSRTQRLRRRPFLIALGLPVQHPHVNHTIFGRRIPSRRASSAVKRCSFERATAFGDRP